MKTFKRFTKTENNRIAKFVVGSISKNYYNFSFISTGNILPGRSVSRISTKSLRPYYSLVFISIFTFGILVIIFLPKSGNDSVSAENDSGNVAQTGTESEQVNEEIIPDDDMKGYMPNNSNAPRYIKIERLKINARVMNMGIDREGRFKSPSNLHDTGWYNQSSFPGTSGAVLVNGHYGNSKKAVFKRLKEIVRGDIIVIERADGKIYKYEVIKTETKSKDSVDMGSLMIPYEESTNGLNIITCDGVFNKKEKTFDNRLLIYAKQI